jgi:hypothetical protein
MRSKYLDCLATHCDDEVVPSLDANLLCVLNRVSEYWSIPTSLAGLQNEIE